MRFCSQENESGEVDRLIATCRSQAREITQLNEELDQLTSAQHDLQALTQQLEQKEREISILTTELRTLKNPGADSTRAEAETEAALVSAETTSEKSEELQALIQELSEQLLTSELSLERMTAEVASRDEQIKLLESKWQHDVERADRPVQPPAQSGIEVAAPSNAHSLSAHTVFIPLRALMISLSPRSLWRPLGPSWSRC